MTDYDRLLGFDPRADLPTRYLLDDDPNLGDSVRALAEALLDGDEARARSLLRADPQLARAPVGEAWTMLELAIAGGAATLINLLIAAGAPLDGKGDGGPLRLALHASSPEPALHLLDAGASAAPRAAPVAPLRAAIGLGSVGAVSLLLDRGADPNTLEPGARAALHIALDMERYLIAELLIDRGADPWAVDATGDNLGSALLNPMSLLSADDEAARRRLALDAATSGWPDPPPLPHAICDAVLAGAWPPPASRAKGAPPPSAASFDAIKARHRP